MPHIHTMHTIYEDFTHFLVRAKALDQITKPAARLLTKYFCNSADRVIVPTSKIDDLLQGYGVTKPISVIPTGIEMNIFCGEEDNSDSREALREQYSIVKSDRVLLYIGRISKEKSIDELLQMLSGYLPGRPRTKFLLVGGGAEVDALKQLAFALGIGSQVIFAGEKPWQTIGQYYKLGDVFIGA